MNWDSTGLMPQIQALIAFPPESQPRGSKSRSHPYYKKPGRSHNHDTCDSCSQAGDLLCCDTCNASFHLLCINPPLTYEQIPTGGWRCHRCKSTQIDPLNQTNKVSKSRRSGKKRSAPPPPIPTIKPPDVPIKKPLMDSSSSASAAATAATKSDDKILAHEGNVVEKFFQRVVDLARKMNPEQFQLPKELMNYGAQQFPGAPRPIVKRQPRANKQIIEMENGMVPNPCVLCFVCDTSCRKGPMIRCDSCSACFHFDCLNPPLTGVPQGKWRCQLHTEQVLEQKVLKSLSLTERVALYDKSKQPFDPIQTALNFVTKSQRAKYYYFRSKIPHKGKNPTKIPGAVVRCYTSNSSEDEDDVIPAWPEIKESSKRIYCEMPRKKDSLVVDGSTSLKLLADVATMDQMFSNQGLEKQTSGISTNFNYSEQQQKQLEKSNELTESNVEKSKGNLDVLGSRVHILEQRLIELKAKQSVEAAIKDSEKSHSLKDDDLLEGLDIKTIRSLAALKLRELRSDETMIESSVSDTEGNETPPPLIDTSVKLSNQNLPNSTTLKSSISNPMGNQKLSTTENYIKDEKLPEGIKEEQLEIPLPFITLQILNSQKEIKFEGESLTIGRGEDNDLDLREHSSCTTPADEHCVIFYDSVCAAWELVNYSPDGTFVNHCLFGCDGDKVSRKKSSSSSSTTTNNNKKVNPLQEILDTTCQRFRFKSDLQSRLDGNSKKRKNCPCSRLYSHQKEVWEGGAKLSESTRIQIGCIRLVVSEIGCEGKLISVVPIQDPLRRNNEHDNNNVGKKSKKSESLDIKEEPCEETLDDTTESDKDSITEGLKFTDDNNDDDILTSSRYSRPRKKLKTLKLLEGEESYKVTNGTATTKPTISKASTRGRRRGRGVIPGRRKRRQSGQGRASKTSPKRNPTRGRKRKADIQDPVADTIDAGDEVDEKEKEIKEETEEKQQQQEIKEEKEEEKEPGEKETNDKQDQEKMDTSENNSIVLPPTADDSTLKSITTTTTTTTTKQKESSTVVIIPQDSTKTIQEPCNCESVPAAAAVQKVETEVVVVTDS